MTMTEAAAHRRPDSTIARSQKRAELPAVQAAIHEALNFAGYDELRRVEVECHGDAVTISGRVPTYYLKQLVQSIALAAPGVGRVTNEVRVS